LDRSLEWCENQILNDLPNDRLKAQPLEVQMKMIHRMGYISLNLVRYLWFKFKTFELFAISCGDF